MAKDSPDKNPSPQAGLPVAAQAAAVRALRDEEGLTLDEVRTKYPDLTEGVNQVEGEQPRRPRGGSGSDRMTRQPAGDLLGG